MRKAGLIVILALGGCLGQPGIRPLRPLEIATAPYQDVTTTAYSGSLMYEGGCLLFRDETTGALLMPVWPAGSIFNGTAVMFHRPGKADQWMGVSEEFVIGGQPIQWGTLGSPPYAPLHHQCGAYAPFLVAAIRPAD